ncbi:putative tripeptidyl-peptidase II [Rosa chinensis]|uniref:Putative tripeptidyl-peptidase II n=1 Tax=Rosa chinensis TaxID=74649 RepID=A0A2P6Q0Q1_ROSCH|nr:subtilisin-like protease SBT3 [Rosa chinensis]PRQ27709.1 putative tripeptidyl-peptidase II [Rosa chinensis]
MATHNHHVPLYLWLSIVTISNLAKVSTLAHESNNYIIHMDSSFMPKAFADHHSWYLSTVDSVLSTSSISSKLIYSYTHVLNGFSASLSVPELEALKTSPGYISSVRDLPVKRDTTHSSQFLGLNSKTGAWPVSNYGKGTIIGLVDTGVWPENESFNDAGMSEIPPRWKGECESGTQFSSSLCNKKLIGARFFNKGIVARQPNVTFTMNSTRDTDGHGTHTSSTAAGNYVAGASCFNYAPGTASGMAPRAHVAMYKALWDEGALSSDIIAAIEQAVVDGVDVLSLSFGLDGVALYEDPVAIATFSAIEKGVFVSTSAGNEGPVYGSLHNGIPWVLTVAASTIDRDFQGTAHLGNGESVTGMTLFPGVNSSSTPIPIVFINACDNLKMLNKVGNKIVLCQDNNSLEEQYPTVQDANVAGGIFITNNTDLELFLQSQFPTLFLSPKEGETIKDYIKSNSNPKVSLEFQKTLLGVRPAPTVTSYTSRGPSSSFPFTLKPDITAPGSLILAAWPRNISVATINKKQVLYSEFNLLSGTSMACPHAAGLAALVKGAHPEWSPAAIRSAMMTTSDILDNTLSSIKDIGDHLLPASPLAMGAGHVNPNKALNPGLIYDATIDDYVNLLCALNYTKEQIQTITRSASNNCSSPSLDLNYPSFIAFFNVNDSKSGVQTTQEFRRTVTNVGKGQSTYIASVTAVKGFEVGVVPNKLVFRREGEQLSFKLSIRGRRLMKETVAFGYLTWVDTEGQHVVRSPIVATKLSSDVVV